MKSLYQKINIPLLLGDFATLTLVAVIGFLTHNLHIPIGRLLANIIPLGLTWLLTAPWFGLLDRDNRHGIHEWWRIVWAVALSAPLALVLRGWVLNAPVLIIFALVMIAFCILALWIWRLIWGRFIQK